jgi:hypothetical protein
VALDYFLNQHYYNFLLGSASDGEGEDGESM